MHTEQGYSDQTAKAAREATLNERLNKVGDSLVLHCDRIEAVLSRINGTPQQPEGNSNAPTPIRATIHMLSMVENLEAVAKRLSELRTGIERIA